MPALPAVVAGGEVGESVELQFKSPAESKIVTIVYGAKR